MNAAIVGELGVEGGGQHAPGTDEDGVVIAACKYLDARAEAADLSAGGSELRYREPATS